MKPRPRSGALWLALTVILGCLCFESPAVASPQYPGELQQALGLNYSPACTLCHSPMPDSGTAAGAIDTPFGKSMVARGLRGASSLDSDAGAGNDAGNIDATLLAALTAMRRDGVDSDGDGAQDLDELSWGGDPNVFDGFHVTPVPPPHYGCQMGRRSSSSSAAWVALLGFVAIAVRGRAIERRR